MNFKNCSSTNSAGSACPQQPGYTLAGVLVLIGIMSIMMAMALPVWERVKQRENEEELIFRGIEYVEAIGRYHQKFNSYPPDLETLVKMKFVRKLYKDPMSESGEWKVLHPGSLVETGEAGFINQPGTGKNDENEEEQNPQKQKGTIPGLGGGKTEGNMEEPAEEEEGESIGPVVGVVSRSKKTALRIYNGQTTYDKWVFAYVPQQVQQQPANQPQQPGKKQDTDRNKNNKKQPAPSQPDIDEEQ